MTHLVFYSVVKQVLATYINLSGVRCLEPTRTGVIWRNIVVTHVRLKSMIPWLKGKHFTHKATSVLFLLDLVVKGIGYHHAGMDLHDRKLIEETFAKGQLPVLGKLWYRNFCHV